jgi:hypothetical protein|nr:MAG TPA: hypothetical protein [Crassvirales sp.]
MLTLNVNGKQGVFTLNLPTTLSDITKEYIANVTSHIEVDDNYTIVGVVFREKLSTLILANRRNKKNSDIAAIPIFVKAGKTNSELITKLDVGEKLIIAPSDIMLGHHLSAPTNLLTINNILNIIEGDMDVYNKVLGVQEQCYFIEFKLVPNCAIHGAYKKCCNDYVNPFVIKTGEAKKNNIIMPGTPKIIV